MGNRTEEAGVACPTVDHDELEQPADLVDSADVIGGVEVLVAVTARHCGATHVPDGRRVRRCKAMFEC